MPSKNNIRTRNGNGNGLTTRLAIMEQSYIAFGNEQMLMREKLDRLYAYVFGSDNPNEESMKSQVKNIGDKVEQLMRAFQESQRETQTIRTEGFARIEDLETWKKQQDEIAKDKKGESRKYIYLVVSVVFSSSVSFLFGWLAQRIFTP